MTPLQHIVEPDRLLLTWQPQDEASPRTRRVVGVVLRRAIGLYGFRYLTDTEDYREAVAAGFKGFPAFKHQDREITQGVVEALVRRLPPRSREDFAEYLALHRLPNPFPASDFALLGYTRARLPSDGFELVPVFSPDKVPCELIIEIAGTRHTFGADVSSVRIGDPVTFMQESANPVDKNAILVCHNGHPIGYVNRALRDVFQQWLQQWHVSAQIERLNGRPDRPLVYVRVTISNESRGSVRQYRPTSPHATQSHVQIRHS